MVELKAHLCAVDRLTGPSHRDSKFFAQARIEREVHRLRRGCRPVLRPCYLCREISIFLNVDFSLPSQAKASLRSEYKSNLQRFLYRLLNCLLFTCLTHDLLEKWFENTMLAKEADPSTKNKSNNNNNNWQQQHQQQSLYLDPLPEHIELALNILEGWQTVQFRVEKR